MGFWNAQNQSKKVASSLSMTLGTASSNPSNFDLKHWQNPWQSYTGYFIRVCEALSHNTGGKLMVILLVSAEIPVSLELRLTQVHIFKILSKAFLYGFMLNLRGSAEWSEGEFPKSYQCLGQYQPKYHHSAQRIQYVPFHRKCSSVVEAAHLPGRTQAPHAHTQNK